MGHVSPEAYSGGPAAPLRDEDIVSIDIPGRKLDVELTDAGLKKRLS